MPIIPAPVQRDYALRALHTLTYGTMPTSRLRGLVCRNTTNQAVQSPTVSGLLSCPNFQAGRYLCAAGLGGFGQGAPVRKAGGAAWFALRTPCPPFVRNARKRGFLSQSGTQTMTQATFTPAPVNAQATITLGDYLAKLTRQLKEPNSYGYDVFMPLVDAVNAQRQALANAIKKDEAEALARPFERGDAPVLNDIVDRLAEQVQAPNNLPHGVFAPLVEAVLAKKEQAKAAKAYFEQLRQGHGFALYMGARDEARLPELEDLKPMPHEWSALAGASLMLKARQVILHNTASGYDAGEHVQSLIEDATNTSNDEDADDGQRGAAVTVLMAISSLAAAMLQTEQGLELLLNLQAESLASAEQWAQQEQAELKAKAMLRPEGGGI